MRSCHRPRERVQGREAALLEGRRRLLPDCDKGHWAVKLGWLDRIAKETEDNADGDDGDDDHKHTFIVEDTPTIVTGVEGLIRVKGIQVTIDGGDACATVPLPLTQAQRKIVRASHDAIMRTNLSRFSSYH